MTYMGFCDKWVALVMECFTSVKHSITHGGEVGNRAWQHSENKKQIRFPPRIHANICVYITHSIGRTNLLSLSNGRYGGPAQHVSRLRDLRL